MQRSAAVAISAMTVSAALGAVVGFGHGNGWFGFPGTHPAPAAAVEAPSLSTTSTSTTVLPPLTTPATSTTTVRHARAAVVTTTTTSVATPPAQPWEPRRDRDRSSDDGDGWDD